MKQARRALDVVTIGAATKDIFVESTHFERMVNSSAPDGFSACLPMGSKIAVDRFVMASGGGATNAAVTFARFGFSTACLSRVGNDATGEDILKELKLDGIGIRGIEKDTEHATAASIIFLSGHGSRCILTARGAGQHLELKSLKKLTASWTYLTSLGGHLRTLEHVFKAAAAGKSRLAWNPGNGELEYGWKKLYPFLRATDVLILNREEAATLVGVAPRMTVDILEHLGQVPRMAFVMTDGARGAFAHSRGNTWHVQPIKGKPINTTGAGDAFGSGFVASLMKDGYIEKALKTGTLNAFGVVTHMGAKAGILKRPPSAHQLSLSKVRVLSSV